VGTTKRVQQLFQSQHPGTRVAFAYSPENLRLGGAIKVFTEPDRIVVGCDSEEARETISQLITPITERIEWMSVASAEMVKHATNAFLATSVTFINEIATLCEYTGANAKEVERGLKSEARIGPKAYLSPGSAFAGGTLARDIAFLGQIAGRHNIAAPLLASVPTSNLRHKEWPYRRIADTLGSIQGKQIAVWGLTYKPGTSTLRRSSSIELCQKLSKEGATVRAFDPAVSELPKELQSVLRLSDAAIDAAQGADALIISTPWPEFREVSMPAVIKGMSHAIILDANGTLSQQCSGIKGLRYFSVGISA
jgi:UDPglucose 6-dehydrogenase